MDYRRDKHVQPVINTRRMMATNVDNPGTNVDNPGTPVVDNRSYRVMKSSSSLPEYMHNSTHPAMQKKYADPSGKRSRHDLDTI